MRPLRTVVAIAVTAALVAACGSGSADESMPVGSVDLDKYQPGPPNEWDTDGFTVDPASLQCTGAAPNPTRGVTDTSVKVGGLAYLTSPNGSSMTGGDIGAQVRFDRANDSGGVNGRTIDFIGVKDDGQDPARNVQEAQKLVEQDEVFAVVPLMTSYPNFSDTLCEAKVPFFGWGFNEAYCDNAVAFGITGCLLPPEPKVDATTWGVVATSVLGGDAEGKSVAVVGIDNDSSRSGGRLIGAQIEAAQIDVVYNEAPIPLAGLNDATPIINAIMRADDGAPPDLVIFPGDFSSTTKITEAMKAVGYEGETLNAVGYDPRLSGFESLDGAHTILQWAPTQADSPGIEQLKADFAKYAPDALITLPAIAGYWAADMFLDLATKTGPDLTVDSFLEYANGGEWQYYVDGAVPLSRWPINHATATPCAGVVELTGGEYVVRQELACGSLVSR